MYSKLIPVNPEFFKGKGFVVNRNYLFAQSQMVCEVVYTELSDIIGSLPMGMIYNQGQPKLVVLLSVIAGKNCFVSPDGRWLGTYSPKFIQGYPFTTYPAPDNPDSEWILCIEESAIKSLQSEGVERLFTDNNEPTERLKSIITFWNNLKEAQSLTDKAVRDLEKAGVFTEWEIVLKSEKEDEPQKIEGLFRIDEAKLKALPSDIAGDLNQSGALSIAYAQLLSRTRISHLQNSVSQHMQYTSEKEKLTKKIEEITSDSGMDWGF
ncbi:hypothetical protein CCZ01_06435 [Helicobacter monodelphidis]|uniref:SapC family protein n=1 Tax=Helicobacter sp. 15-1451 TaxID=2004995 RepID=UPI000DCBEA17|nr:SapC family protein [Helicobacter sp. 15-1451]RAX57332.1 hypothetical protein CCZ01_06435 [Helicobacter sp. 15-1451]